MKGGGAVDGNAMVAVDDNAMIARPLRPTHSPPASVPSDQIRRRRGLLQPASEVTKNHRGSCLIRHNISESFSFFYTTINQLVGVNIYERKTKMMTEQY